jgi:hypothetical protein
MTKSSEFLNQILQSKTYYVNIQNKKFDNVIYQKHQTKKFKSEIFL